MSTIIVCGLSEVENVIAARRPSHMITLLDPWSMIDTPVGLEPERHLRLGVNDICDPTDGMVLADEAMVQSVVDFGRTWDESAPMLIHCWAGISRSTASAFTLACERNPDVGEVAIAQAMRAAAPHAWPNRRIVGLADDLLGRQGRMVDAVNTVMAEYDHLAACPFEFSVRY